jgi:hypothetical protein
MGKARSPEPRVEKLPKDVLDTIRERVRTQVRAGYDSLADIKRALAELDPDELFDDGTITEARLRKEARALLDVEVAALVRDAKKWPAQTDNDRLDAAFGDLEANYGVLARQDYWCCQTCGCAAIADEMAETRKGKRNKKPPGALGYVFFHNQDTEAAVERGGLMLAYGSSDVLDERTRAVGRVIVGVLREHHLEPAWNGDIGTRIFVPIIWRRRLPKRTVARP